MDNPYVELTKWGGNLAANKLINGEMTFTEAVDYAWNLINALSITPEFEKVLENYYNDFIDVKDVGKENKEWHVKKIQQRRLVVL